jgi:hypothetical protein
MKRLGSNFGGVSSSLSYGKNLGFAISGLTHLQNLRIYALRIHHKKLGICGHLRSLCICDGRMSLRFADLRLQD